MLFTIDKDSLLNKLKIVEKVTAQRGNVQPVLANVLFEAENNVLNLSATDLEISIKAKTTVAVKKEGKITLPAKKLLEIAAKLPDKPVEFSLNEDTNVVNITCGNSKFEIIGISAQEFPKIDEEISSGTEIEIELEPLLKSIKNTVYAAANYENRNVISGVYCLIKGNKLEMAATDGNRLTRIVEVIKNKDDKSAKLVIPSKTLNEFVFKEVYDKPDENGEVKLKYKSLHDLAMFLFNYVSTKERHSLGISDVSEKLDREKQLLNLKKEILVSKPNIKKKELKRNQVEGQISFFD